MLTSRRLIAATLSFAASALLLACTTSTLTTTNPSPVKCQVSVPGSLPMMNASGGSATVAVSASPECAWTATIEAAWITEVKPKSGQGNGSVEVVVAANASATTRAGNIKVNDAVVPVSQEAAPCQFSVTGPASAVSAAGGTASVTVTTLTDCSWTSASAASWLTVSSGASGSGPGTATFTAAANSGAARSGTVTVAGLTITISQTSASCSYSISPTSQSVAAGGGSGTISVTTGTACAWTATADVPWITVSGSGTGSGSVTFTVAANAGAGRLGTISIGDQSFSVGQDGTTPAPGPTPPGPTPPAPTPPAPTPCVFTLGGTAQSVSNAAGPAVSVSVTTTAACAWTAATTTPWISITSGSSGLGNGSVAFSVTANTGAQRIGTITIAAQTYTVTQASAACSYNISSNAAAATNSGGPGSPVGVTANVATCAWTATSNDIWLTITSGSSGVGNGSVGYSAAANLGPARTGTLTIAGHTFTVTQAAPPCSFTLSASAASLANSGGPASPVGVTANLGTCAWTANSNDGWLTITSGNSGVGNGSVGYSAAANTGPARSGTLTIAGQTFTANQATGCTFSLSRTFQGFPAPATTAPAVTVTTPNSACSWTAVSNVPWITVAAPGGGTGTGPIGFSVSANTTGSDRSGTITIAGITFNVDQGH